MRLASYQEVRSVRVAVVDSLHSVSAAIIAVALPGVDAIAGAIGCIRTAIDAGIMSGGRAGAASKRERGGKRRECGDLEFRFHFVRVVETEMTLVILAGAQWTARIGSF